VNTALEEWLAAAHRPAHALVLNPDTELCPGALDALLGATGEDVAVVGPSLTYPDGRFQHAAFKEPGVVQTVLDLVPVARLADSPLNGRYGRDLYANGPFEVDFPLGACMLVNVAAVARAGVMDESFFMYCEEMEWCRRFRGAGFRILCAPEARVVHVGGAATGRVRADMWVRLWNSRLAYYRLRGPRWRSALLRAVVASLLGVRTLVGGPGAPPAVDIAGRRELRRQALAR
jgi:GT2 family glycosyltransferase